MEFRDPFDIENEKFEREIADALAEPTTTQQDQEFEEQWRNAAERDRYYFSEIDREQAFNDSLERPLNPIARDEVDPELWDIISASDDEMPRLPKAATMRTTVAKSGSATPFIDTLRKCVNKIDVNSPAVEWYLEENDIKVTGSVRKALFAHFAGKFAEAKRASA